MTLVPGVRLGPYEVLAPLGAGGMGEVYRARDTRLGREVAVKVLPADALADETRRQRFLREAQAASALNHPQIVTIHEIESHGDVDFIVMELVPGATLADRLDHGPLRPEEALRLAIPIADALAAAHGAGIVHRDLKPANVMITPDGVVKVLDFGLAKVLPGQAQEETPLAALAHSGTTASLSRAGTVVGTVGYMSPEQASGGNVDARSDVFSFGAVLYEMVTGRRAFTGHSGAETLVAVLREDPPPPSTLAHAVSRELERIILRCLRKDPSRRFQHMLDVKIELLELKEEHDSQASGARAASGVGSAPLRRRGWIAIGGLAALALAGLAFAGWRAWRVQRVAASVVQLTSALQAGSGSFAPDGNEIAFDADDRDGRRNLWLAIVGGAEVRRLTNDASADDHPAWSPDGRQIAFLRHRPGEHRATIQLVSPLGGKERRLSDFAAWDQLSWSPDGRWLAAAAAWWEAASRTGVFLIPTAGGDPRQLTVPEAPAYDTDVAFSPDGSALAYVRCDGALGSPACDVWVQPLDASARASGRPRRVTSRRYPNAGLAWSRDGRSILFGAAAGQDSRLWRVAADGSAAPERLELAGAGAVEPTAVRGADRLAFVRIRSDSDIHRFRLGEGASPLVETSFYEGNPQYSPDGRRLAFESVRVDEGSQVWLADADGSNPTRLTQAAGAGQGSPRWSPDGRTIAFDVKGESGHFDVWTARADGSGLRQVTFDASDENMPSFSRDGRSLYYASNRTGRFEIWRSRVDGGGAEQITNGGGFLPFESLDGRTLYYKRGNGDDALVARPTTGGGQERVIVDCVDYWAYAVTASGVYHVDCKPPDAPFPPRRALHHWDAASGKDRIVAMLDFGPREILGLTATPDGKEIAYPFGVMRSDLMMIEHFR